MRLVSLLLRARRASRRADGGRRDGLRARPVLVGGPVTRRAQPHRGPSSPAGDVWVSPQPSPRDLTHDGRGVRTRPRSAGGARAGAPTAAARSRRSRARSQSPPTVRICSPSQRDKAIVLSLSRRTKSHEVLTAVGPRLQEIGDLASFKFRAPDMTVRRRTTGAPSSVRYC